MIDRRKIKCALKKPEAGHGRTATQGDGIETFAGRRKSLSRKEQKLVF
jgi:hypothetical protein